MDDALPELRVTRRAGLCPAPGCERFLTDHDLTQLRACMAVIAELDNRLRERACGGAMWAANDRAWRARRRIAASR